MKVQLRVVVLFLIAILHLGCSGNDNNSGNTSLVSSTYSPNQSYLIADTNTTIDVVGNYSNHSSKNLNPFLNWESNNTDIATVDSGVISTSSSVGLVTIAYETKDTLPSGEPVLRQKIKYEVVDASLLSIEITKPSSDIYVDQEYQLSATGVFDIGDANQTLQLSQLNWNSDDETVATVDADGVLRGVAKGLVNISAKDIDSNISSSISIEILDSLYGSIKITTDSKKFNVDETIQLNAVGTNQDDEETFVTDKVIWSSLDEDVVRVDTDGLATAVAKGNATIKATLDSLESSVVLEVQKDQYLRLTDITDEESQRLSFPYICYYNMQCVETITKPSSSTFVTLKTFKLEAIGGDFTINDLAITNYAGDISYYNIGGAKFDNIQNATTIAKDDEITFSLLSNSNIVDKELVFSFRINDESAPSFVASYLFKTE